MPAFMTKNIRLIQVQSGSSALGAEVYSLQYFRPRFYLEKATVKPLLSGRPIKRIPSIKWTLSLVPKLASSRYLPL